jgi:hypothetical protein
MTPSEDGFDPPESFYSYYSIQETSIRRQVLIAMYFSLTSLSTVGFGDYHPRANIERIFCAIILILGVMIFSQILDAFIGMI